MDVEELEDPFLNQSKTSLKICKFSRE